MAEIHVPNANLFVEDIHESVREYNKAHPNAPIKYDMEAGSANSWWVSLLPTALMIVLLIGGLVYMTRRMESDDDQRDEPDDELRQGARQAGEG